MTSRHSTNIHSLVYLHKQSLNTLERLVTHKQHQLALTILSTHTCKSGMVRLREKIITLVLLVFRARSVGDFLNIRLQGLNIGESSDWPVQDDVVSIEDEGRGVL